MEFFLKYGIYLAFGAGTLIALITIIIGIVAMKKDTKLSKNKIYTAKVLTCIIGENYIPGMRMQGFDIILDITTPKKNVRKEIKRRDPMDVGTTVEVYYDAKKDVVRFTDEAFDEEKKYPIVLVAFGFFFLLLTIISFIGVNFNNGRALVGSVGGLIISGIFIFIGIWLSFIRPHKVNKNMIYCEKVEGRIADVVRQGKTSGGNELHRHAKSTYSYLYEYEYGGMTRTIKGSTSSNTFSHSQIGKKAEIVINHKTGEVFCMDDVKTGIGMGIVFLIFGILAIPFVLFASGAVSTGKLF